MAFGETLNSLQSFSYARQSYGLLVAFNALILRNRNLHFIEYSSRLIIIIIIITTIIIIIIIIKKCDIYITPFQLEAALRRFTALFTIVLSLTQTCFHPAHISTPKGAYNASCHYRRKALLTHSHRGLSGTPFFMDE